MLDSIEIRVLGVLLEKHLAVPDNYPLTDNTLLAGCNQKSNREPELQLELPSLRRALQSLQNQGLVLQASGSGRAVKYRHSLQAQHEVDTIDQAILAELMVRGPQAPGALKARVVRMGIETTPDDILLRLQAMRDRGLCSQHPRRPRERDWRWGHALGAEDLTSHQPVLPPEGAIFRPEAPAATPASTTPPAPAPSTAAPTPAAVATPDTTLENPAPLTRLPTGKATDASLEQRVAELERQVAELRTMLGRGHTTEH